MAVTRFIISFKLLFMRFPWLSFISSSVLSLSLSLASILVSLVIISFSFAENSLFSASCSWESALRVVISEAEPVFLMTGFPASKLSLSLALSMASRSVFGFAPMTKSCRSSRRPFMNNMILCSSEKVEEENSLYTSVRYDFIVSPGRIIRDIRW